MHTRINMFILKLKLTSIIHNELSLYNVHCSSIHKYIIIDTIDDFVDI